MADGQRDLWLSARFDGSRGVMRMLRPRVAGIGPQLGYVPLNEHYEGYRNMKPLPCNGDLLEVATHVIWFEPPQAPAPAREAGRGRDAAPPWRPAGCNP